MKAPSHLFLLIITFLTFFATPKTAQAQAGSCVPPNETCTANAGVPKPTEPIGTPPFFQASGEFVTQPTYNIAEYKYEYLITQSIDTSGNGDFADIVVGITENGYCDLSALQPGDYKVIGIIFCQNELASILNNPYSYLICCTGIDPNMNLNEFLTLVANNNQIFPNKQFTVQDVLDLLTGPIPGFPLTLSQLIGFQPCVDAADEPFSITLVQETVGINNNTSKNGTVVAYPNPVQNGEVLNVKFTTPNNVQNLNLIDAVGKVVFEMPQPQQENIKINTEQLNAGNYLLKYIENSKVYIKKIQILK